MIVAALAGVHDARPPAAVIAAFGGATVGREFIAGEQPPADLRAKVDRLAAPWLSIGGQVYVSFKPRPADVASGTWAPWLEKLGAWLSNHPGVKLIVWHEPEDDMSGAQFATMFNACRNAVKTGWADATVAYCAMAYHWRAAGNAGKNPTGWQRVIADEYLVDVYSGVSFAETAILPEHPGFVAWYEAIVKPKLDAGQPVSWGVAERGFQAKNPAARAATIRREADWLAARGGDRPMLYLAWNTGGTEGDSAWLLDAAGEEAMRYLLTTFLASDTQPDLEDRYQRGYADGRASRDAEIQQVRDAALGAGRTRAYAEMIEWARSNAIDTR